LQLLLAVLVEPKLLGHPQRGDSRLTRPDLADRGVIGLDLRRARRISAVPLSSQPRPEPVDGQHAAARALFRISESPPAETGAHSRRLAAS
jgi:hypothetical protein